MRVEINILQSIRRFEHGLVNGHAVSNHAHRIFIVFAVRAFASRNDVRINILGRIIGEQIGKVYHQTFGAPVGNQSFRSFQNEVGSLSAFDGGIDLVVAVLIIQIFDSDIDVRILLVERSNEGINFRGIAPAADRIGPQRDIGCKVCTACRFCRSLGCCCRSFRCLRFACRRCRRRCRC